MKSKLHITRSSEGKPFIFHMFFHVSFNDSFVEPLSLITLNSQGDPLVPVPPKHDLTKVIKPATEMLVFQP